MRVLTKYEREQFEIAFKHISALSSMQNELTELYCLRHGNDGQSPIPPNYFTLSEAVGGFGAMREKFSPMYRKETTEWLMRFCFDNCIQPSSFEIIGAVRKIHVERKNYTEHHYKSG
jgi:hypothetical protein